MTVFSKFMKLVTSKLETENLMTDEIKMALNSIERPSKRKISEYHLLMKKTLNEVVAKYPNEKHKIRFKMAAQITSLIHKHVSTPELAWKIVEQRTFGEPVVTENTIDTEIETTSNDTSSSDTSSSGVVKKRKQDIKYDEELIEIPLSDVTNVVNVKPTMFATMTTRSKGKIEEKKLKEPMKNDEDEHNDKTILKQMREFVKNKPTNMHINDRYKIANKMCKLYKEGEKQIDKIYNKC
uniref:Uncharacterized protein n=1 Tax=viral metagenome TaxID=1070528 RepID=A0A6C0BPR6_9ZZZZ